jgi:hypothetical protein
MASVLACVAHHGLEAVLVSVELALESGRVSGEHVMNVLSRLAEPVATMHAAPVRVVLPEQQRDELQSHTDSNVVPASLTLAQEPRADAQRYELLRKLEQSEQRSPRQEPNHV